MPIIEITTVITLILNSLILKNSGSNKRTMAGAVYCKKIALAAVVSLVASTNEISNTV